MTAHVLSFYGTSVGKKVVMAVSGLLMVFFVVMHMLGNLHMYSGPAKMNSYAAFLASLPGPLWAFRSLLMVALALHLYTGLSLILQGFRARPSRYARRTYQAAKASSRTMWITGPLLLAFVIYHLLHQTFGTILAGFDKHEVYNNVIIGLGVTPAAAVYAVAMLVLGLHIKHGIWSLLQTLGLNIPRYDRLLRAAALLVSVVLVAGFISIPIAIKAGLIH